MGKKDLEDDLDKSCIPKAIPFLTEVARKTCDQILKEFGEAEAKRNQGNKKLETMPSLSNEDAYRTKGLKSVKALAACARAMGEAQKTVEECRQALASLNIANFGGEDPPWATKFRQDPLLATEAEQASVQGASIASFHVAAVAALCTLRSDQVANKEGKALKNSADVAATLRSRWESLENGGLKKESESLLQECEDAASFSKGSRRTKADKDTKAKESAQPSATGHGQDQAAAVEQQKERQASESKDMAPKEEKDEKDKKDKKAKKEGKEKKEKKEKKDKKDKKEKKHKKEEKEDKKSGKKWWLEVSSLAKPSFGKESRKRPRRQRQRPRAKWIIPRPRLQGRQMPKAGPKPRHDQRLRTLTKYHPSRLHAKLGFRILMVLPVFGALL